MIFHVLTIFPEFFQGPFEHGVVARAAKSGVLQIRTHNLRNWTKDLHQTVDDRPFGGGEGMVLKPESGFRGCGVDSARPGPVAPACGADVGAGSVVDSRRGAADERI